MPMILSLSSQVARGTVGHAVNDFIWQRLGFETMTLPTVLLSNRPDYPLCTGERLNAQLLEEMLSTLEKNGFLDDVAAIFTGYLPSVEYVALAARWVERLKSARPAIIYCCDPIFGDEPGGLYIAEAAAAALRDTLVPKADIVTPNRFELGWLAQCPVLNADDSVGAARNLSGLVLATSSPSEQPGFIANIAVDDEEVWQAVTPFREAVPHGTGDMLSALFLAHILRGNSARNALALAVGGLETVIEASMDRDELALIATQGDWADPAPWPVEPVSTNAS